MSASVTTGEASGPVAKSAVEASTADAPAGARSVGGRLPQIPQLDGLRAIAIGLVFVAHSGLQKLVPGGFGVTLFFFLSGYLITTLMRIEVMQTGDVSLRNFYLRRLLRICPPLYITLFLVWVLCATGFYDVKLDLISVLSQIFFFTNYATYFGHEQGLPDLPLWSLAVEEHFYLLFPLLYISVLKGMKPQQAALVCLTLCLAVLALRLVNVVLQEDFSANYYLSHTRIDSILFGCCLALWNNPIVDADAYRPRIWHALAALAVLLGCLLVRSEAFREGLRYSLQGAALFVLFSYALQAGGWLRDLLSSRVAARIGLYSYSIYLGHVVILHQVGAQAPWLGKVGGGVVAFALVLVYGELMYRFVERPAAGLRRRLHHVVAPRPHRT